MAQTSLYMLYRLDLPLGGDRVRLFGLLAARGDSAEFVVTTPAGGSPPVGSAETLPATMFPADVTTQIVDPFGLDGVTLTKLALAGRVYRYDGVTTVDIAVGATAVFPRLSTLMLDAALVIDAGMARLAVITLSTAKPLTLTDFLTGVLGSRASWGADVTDQFAFVSGTLSWLQGEAGATFAYPKTGPGVVTYLPGYHLKGDLTVFGQRLSVDVGVVEDANSGESVTTVTATIARIGFDFAALKTVQLGIVNARSGSRLGIDAQVELFGSDVAAVRAEYDTRAKAFAGRVSAAIGPASLPIVGSVSFTLSVDFQWSDQGFRIQALGGLPTGLPDIAKDLMDVFNTARSGGCEAVVQKWIPDLTTRFAPSLSDSLSRTAGGDLLVPLRIDYTLALGGTDLRSAGVNIPLTLAIPSSIGDLPAKLWQGVEDNLQNVVAAILRDTATYEVIAIQIGKQGGAAAFASMICRALREFLEELAKNIARQAVALASDAIAAVAALAGMLVAVALLGVKELLDLFEDLWNEIKKIFGGDDDDKKEEAETAVRDQRTKVEAAIAVVDARIADARAKMKIASLRTSLSDDGASVIATIAWQEGRPTSDKDGNGHFTCTLDLLSGPPRKPGAPPPPAPENKLKTLPLGQDVVACPLADLGGGYRMNAVAQPAVNGIMFMDDATAQQLAAAANTLRDIDNDVARSFGDYLDEMRMKFDALNKSGIVGDPVYATTDVPAFMTVGKSRVGFNTRLPE